MIIFIILDLLLRNLPEPEDLLQLARSSWGAIASLRQMKLKRLDVNRKFGNLCRCDRLC